MNRIQLRNEVRSILRDDNYPASGINAALNRVLSDINLMGRFRFHQSSEDIVIDGGFFGYDVAPYILAEELVVYDPDSPKYVILKKYPTHTEARLANAFTTVGTPKFYSRWADHWLFDPMPGADLDGKIIRVYYFEDLQPMESDLEIPLLPLRYHRNVLVYGAAYQVRPMAMAAGGVSVGSLYGEAIKMMKIQELWEPWQTFNLQLSDRFRNISRIGNVGSIRG